MFWDSAEKQFCQPKKKKKKGRQNPKSASAQMPKIAFGKSKLCTSTSLSLFKDFRLFERVKLGHRIMFCSCQGIVALRKV